MRFKGLIAMLALLAFVCTGAVVGAQKTPTKAKHSAAWYKKHPRKHSAAWYKKHPRKHSAAWYKKHPRKHSAAWYKKHAKKKS